MYTNNPYAQGGWYNPENPMSINPRVSASYVPSVFGALPVLDSGTGERSLTFQLVPNEPDILNCSIFAPNGNPYIEITSDYSSAPCTYFRKRDGTVLAYIEWSQRPMVCIPGILDKVPVSRWLALSADKRYVAWFIYVKDLCPTIIVCDRSRTMVAKDRPFVWVPKDNQIAVSTARWFLRGTYWLKTWFAKLFAIGSTIQEPLATISKNRTLVTLKLTTEAVTAGLLESGIVATVLLQSGRNIDWTILSPSHCPNIFVFYISIEIY